MSKSVQLNIVEVPINKLIPSTYNPRKWSDDALSQLKESTKKFGVVDPILANGNERRRGIVIGGHMRLKACKEIGL